MSQAELFNTIDTQIGNKYRPLADLQRPANWDEFVGAERIDPHLLKRLKSGSGPVPSMILWGPPGTGKTTLARLIGNTFNCEFVELSAVLAGVKDIRELVEAARRKNKPTLLFVDEIHRFNKSQQDAFLPHVESGVIALIGATTENPSFYLTQALLSRLRVVHLAELDEQQLEKILKRALIVRNVQMEPAATRLLCNAAECDARKLLNLLEAYLNAGVTARDQLVKEENIRSFLAKAGTFFYDRKGDQHYQIISAFIKSLRGSDADAALYWGFRMLEAGEDPRFLIRRMIIFASEDISNADSQALVLAVSTAEAFDRIGLPEGRIPIAHLITYLANAPKSNRSYLAMHKAIAAVQEFPRAEVPLHLRNAPTGLMQSMDYGKDYVYPHDLEEGFVPDVTYLPKELEGQVFYEPSQHGIEKTYRVKKVV